MNQKVFRVISIITLSLFIWVFMLFDVAYAVKSEQQSALSAQVKTKGKGPAEKFEKAIEGIEQILTDTDTDTATKKNKLKTKKSEIQSLDVEIKKQFAETKKKLKDAKLPEEILKRHEDFVKQYEDSLKELTTNLDDIEKAKGKVEVKAEVEKTKKYLKKIKPPKKHTPLGPNKLPHRQPEFEKKEPRTKPEEFGPQSTQRAQREGSKQEKTNNQQLTTDNQSILVASNRTLSGLLDGSQLTVDSSPFTVDSQIIPQSEIPNPQFLLAQADPPTSDDLAETIEVQFTDAIIAKALELEHKPVLIYNWVRNNIEFVPTYGSIQGADYCLQTKLCNAFDTASLLIALLRASGIHARYVEGTVEIPIEKVKNWVGGFTDSNSALSFIASGGIPVGGITSGGKIVDVQMEHIYVEAWIDMIPSQGAIHKAGDMWVPLDASFKQYSYTQGIDIQSAIPFDEQSFIDPILATTTINEVESYVTGVDSLFINQTMN